MKEENDPNDYDKAAQEIEKWVDQEMLNMIMDNMCLCLQPILWVEGKEGEDG